MSAIVRISSRRRTAACRLRRILGNGPNSRIASARAASGAQPRATSCDTRMSRWKRISSSISAAACAGRRTASRNRRRTRGRTIGATALGRAWGGEDARHRRGILDPALRLSLEVGASSGRELVIARAATVLRLAPVGVYGATLLEPDERVVERPILDAELAAGPF